MIPSLHNIHLLNSQPATLGNRPRQEFVVRYINTDNTENTNNISITDTAEGTVRIENIYDEIQPDNTTPPQNTQPRNSDNTERSPTNQNQERSDPPPYTIDPPEYREYNHSLPDTVSITPSDILSDNQLRHIFLTFKENQQTLKSTFNNLFALTILIILTLIGNIIWKIILKLEIKRHDEIIQNKNTDPTQFTPISNIYQINYDQINTVSKTLLTIAFTIAVFTKATILILIGFIAITIRYENYKIKRIIEFLQNTTPFRRL
jgi:hypothetical protein